MGFREGQYAPGTTYALPCFFVFPSSDPGVLQQTRCVSHGNLAVQQVRWAESGWIRRLAQRSVLHFGPGTLQVTLIPLGLSFPCDSTDSALHRSTALSIVGCSHNRLVVLHMRSIQPHPIG